MIVLRVGVIPFLKYRYVPLEDVSGKILEKRNKIADVVFRTAEVVSILVLLVILADTLLPTEKKLYLLTLLYEDRNCYVAAELCRVLWNFKVHYRLYSANIFVYIVITNTCWFVCAFCDHELKVANLFKKPPRKFYSAIKIVIKTTLTILKLVRSWSRPDYIPADWEQLIQKTICLSIIFFGNLLCYILLSVTNPEKITFLLKLIFVLGMSLLTIHYLAFIYIFKMDIRLFFYPYY